MTVNAPAQPVSGNMDVDEFMAFLETRPDEEHWELIEGVAVMMAPPTFAHQRIVYNLCNLLNTAFAARRLGLFAYFDVGVAGYDRYSERFQLVAEVLSLSNTRQEIELKMRRYREARDNLYAVVIEPRDFMVEIHAKSRNWQPAILKRPDDVIEMPEFALRCNVVDLYRGTPLDPG